MVEVPTLQKPTCCSRLRPQPDTLAAQPHHRSLKHSAAPALLRIPTRCHFTRVVSKATLSNGVSTSFADTNPEVSSAKKTRQLQSTAPDTALCCPAGSRWWLYCCMSCMPHSLLVNAAHVLQLFNE